MQFLGEDIPLLAPKLNYKDDMKAEERETVSSGNRRARGNTAG